MSLDVLRDLVAVVDAAERRRAAGSAPTDAPPAGAPEPAKGRKVSGGTAKEGAVPQTPAAVVHVPVELLAAAAAEVALEGHASGSATSELHFLLKLVAVLGPQDAADLRDLLALTISAPAPGERRAGELELLVSMALAGGGEVPGVRDYEELRAREDDPAAYLSASKLSRDYGGWAAAVRAAMRMAFDPVPRVPANHRHVPTEENPQRKWSVSELAVALLRGARTLGFWPGERDWIVYEQVARELHRHAGGAGECPVPSIEPFRTRWGNFNAGVRAVQRMVREYAGDAGRAQPRRGTDPLAFR